jgi:hypothetical protein
LLPALVAYQWGVAAIAEYGKAWSGSAGSRRSSTSPARRCGVARFNARAATVDKRYFRRSAEPVGGWAGGRLRVVLERVDRARPDRVSR